MVQFSNLYATTGKTTVWTKWTFVDKLMCLHFNTLSRFVIALLPRGKRLLISWLQSVLSQLFHSPPSPSSRGSLVPLCFLPLEWYYLHIWGCWYFSWQSQFQLVIYPARHFERWTLHVLWYVNKVVIKIKDKASVVCKKELQGQEGLSGQRTRWNLWLPNRDAPLVNSGTKELGPKKPSIFPRRRYLFLRFSVCCSFCPLFSNAGHPESAILPWATFSPEFTIQSPSTCCAVFSLQTDPHDSSPWTGFPALPSSFLFFLLGWASRLAQS